ncbi:hypothetical protein ACFRAQ_36200 [Nocardia sp. NPDC056611]|uniref:hypothetical protein n=1 Tax=Nocardia sp. NPDC056611 TaxID=3345877 RepID=UPI00366BC288
MSDNDIRTVSTLDEWLELTPLSRMEQRVWASGELADDVRERLSGTSHDSTWVNFGFDISTLRYIISFNCGQPEGAVSDVAMAMNTVDDIEPVRAWLGNREPDPELIRHLPVPEPITKTLAEALADAIKIGGRNLWEAVQFGICPERGAWSECSAARPPAGMYALWEQAIDLVYPLIGVDEAQFEHDYDRYYAYRCFPDLEAWWDRDPDEVMAVLRQAAVLAERLESDSQVDVA